MTVGKRARREDPVTPELAAYVLDRDRGCVVQRIAPSLARPLVACRDRNGEWLSNLEALFVARLDWPRVLTLAHIRDRRGGRTGRRPPSTARRLVAVCAGHHLLDPIVDRADVRPLIERYLEEREGPDEEDPARPWEVVRRVRSASDGTR